MVYITPLVNRCFYYYFYEFEFYEYYFSSFLELLQVMPLISDVFESVEQFCRGLIPFMSTNQQCLLSPLYITWPTISSVKN